MQLFSGLRRDEPIEVQRRPPELKIDEDAYGMGQDFANQPVLIVPQIMDANAGHSKPFGQVRAKPFQTPLRRRAQSL